MTLAAQDDAIETDDGRKSAAAAERMCALTRAVKPVDELIRFVVQPDGQVIPDLKRNLPGRGLWLTASRPVLADAIKRKVFTRGFKRDVGVNPEFVALTESLLARGALDALSIAAKAGQVVTGFMKVERAIATEKLTALLHARDGAPDGVRKLNAAAYRPAPDGAEQDGEADKTPQIPVISAFTTDQLDLALGRSNVVHAAVLAGPASRTFLSRASLFEGFCADGVVHGPAGKKTRKGQAGSD